MYILISLVKLYEESSTQCNKALKKKEREKGWGGTNKVIEVHRTQKEDRKLSLFAMTWLSMQNSAKQSTKNPPNPS